MGEPSIRPLRTIEEYRAAEDLQHAVWRLHEREIVPDHVMLTAQRHGGLALGAFAPSGKMVGMLFGFLGTGDEALGERWLHCSHIMGVLPEWQGRGIGFRLKLAQRRWALHQGLKLIVWTYEPLESRNAALNVGKLGAICRRYRRDLYGAMRDALNAGLPSDRLEVEWWIASPHVRQRLEGARPEHDPAALDVPPANRVSWRADGLPVPSDVEGGWDGPATLLEIPADFQGVRQSDMKLAEAWRQHTRNQFEAAFAAGYAAVDFIGHTDEAGVRRSYYLLRPAASLDLRPRPPASGSAPSSLKRDA
jgi:predicted GNAT superfamily acetyltransferase